MSETAQIGKMLREMAVGDIGQVLLQLSHDLPLRRRIERVIELRERVRHPTALKTLNLPEISALRPHLISEVSVYDHLEGGNETILLAGRADAISLGEGKATVAIDWKSDIAPSEDDIAAHTSQLRRYLAATGAQRGAIVYMTSGAVHWLD
jgi:hypothetical protein